MTASALAAVPKVAIGVHVKAMFTGTEAGDVARDEDRAVRGMGLHEHDVTSDV